MLLLALWPVQSDASIAVIVARREQVIVAADSRQTTNGVTDDFACKVRMGPLSIFVATGEYPITVLDEVWAAGDRLTRQYGTALEHLRGVERLLANKRFAPSNRGALAFVEMTPTGPFAAAAKFKILHGKIAFEEEIRDWRGPEFGAGYVVLYNDKMAETDSAIAGSLTKQSAALPDLVALAVRIVDKQAAVDKSVHRPIDVAIIDGAGPRWLQCKAECGQGCPR
jgi:hypothetical protein